MIKVLKDWSPPPALGPVPEALNDPAVRMLWGITSERIESWLNPDPDEVVGVAASSGVVEGIARVLHDVARDRLAARGRDPRRPGDRAVVGAGVRQDQGGGLGHRRVDVARRDRRPRVRACPPSSAAATRPSGSGPATGSGSTATGARSGCCQMTPGPRRVPLADAPSAADGRREGRQPRRAGPGWRRGTARVRGDRRARSPRPWPRSTRPARCARRSRRCPPADLAEIAPGGRPRAVAGAPLPVTSPLRSRPAYAALSAGYAALGEARRRRGALVGDRGGQRGRVVRRPAGHLPRRVRRRRGARARAPLLGVACTTTSRSPTAAASACPRPASRWRSSCSGWSRPRAAGVMFTRSPVTGDRSVVAIEGTWGLGSALVSGDVTPDSSAISKITGEITARRVSPRLTIHRYIPNGRGRAPVHVTRALR